MDFETQLIFYILNISLDTEYSRRLYKLRAYINTYCLL